MSDFVIFQIDKGYRALLIEQHNFYVDQSRERLLKQFTEDAIIEEANTVAESAFSQRVKKFHPDITCAGDLAEAANEDGIWRYQLLKDLSENTRLNIIAGFFHNWEKNLRNLLVIETGKWHLGIETARAIWKQDLTSLFDLLEAFGWNLKASPYFCDLDACRLVVNVYKHGDGPSLVSLEAKYPHFLVKTGLGHQHEESQEYMPVSYKDLNISDPHMVTFADAIRSFWENVPDQVVSDRLSNLPDWFANAYKKSFGQSGKK